MKRLTLLAPVVLIAFVLALLLASCDWDAEPAQSPGIEIDIDHPKAKKTPKTTKRKAPAYRAPSAKRRR
nr:hypothetical protein [Streptomyces antibioticus]